MPFSLALPSCKAPSISCASCGPHRQVFLRRSEHCGVPSWKTQQKYLSSGRFKVESRSQPGTHEVSRIHCSQATSSEAAEHDNGDGEEGAEAVMGLSTLEQFIELNVGSWSGTFTVRFQMEFLFRLWFRLILA